MAKQRKGNEFAFTALLIHHYGVKAGRLCRKRQTITS